MDKAKTDGGNVAKNSKGAFNFSPVTIKLQSNSPMQSVIVPKAIKTRVTDSTDNLKKGGSKING